MGNGSKTKLDQMLSNPDLDNIQKQSEYEKVTLDNLSESILKMYRNDKHI